MVGLTRHSSVLACSDTEATSGSTARADHDQRLGLLLKTIEGEVIPRLMLSHRADGLRLPLANGVANHPRADEVDALTALLLGMDADAISAFVQKVRARGITTEALYLELLTPAARLLGRMWEEDRCDFTAVTLGLWRLQRLLYELSPTFQMEFGTGVPRDGRRVLLNPVPGEQHTFGMFMVAEFFRRGGWEVYDGPSCSHAHLVELARANWFGVIGISASCERWLDELRAVVADVRRVSRNPGISIIVGGSMFLRRAELAREVGADGTALDAARAVELAQSLLIEPRQIC